MTTPDERFRALKQTRKLLEDLCDPGKTPRVPSIVRDRARGILRTYLNENDMNKLADTCPEVLERTSATDKIKQITR